MFSRRISGDRLKESYNKYIRNICTYYRPFKKICIVENVAQWKLIIYKRIFIKLETKLWHAKLYCEWLYTEFVLDFTVNTHKGKNINVFEKLDASDSLVGNFMQPNLGVDHTLYVDNWCTSPYIFQYLNGG